MGCSSSKKAPPAGRRTHGLRSRSLSSVLSSLGMCRGRNGGVLHAYAKLPSAGDAAAAKWSPAVAEAAALPGAVATSSSWPARAAAADLDYLPGLRQIVEDYCPMSSHPSLLYPEHDHPVPPPPPPPPETTCDDDAVVDMGTPAARDIPEVVITTGIVRARVDEFREQMQKKKKKNKEDKISTTTAPDIEGVDLSTPRSQSGNNNKAVVVLYFTSLRGVRRTFEDGRAARGILRCYGVRVDERDVSMHATFKAELRDLLLHAGPTLPRVFIVDGGGLRYCDLGGAEELRELHEAGELASALAGCEPARLLSSSACAACGDARFAVCDACHGSCKLFVAGCFQRCPDCNENGLVRCPVCCY